MSNTTHQNAHPKTAMPFPKGFAGNLSYFAIQYAKAIDAPKAHEDAMWLLLEQAALEYAAGKSA